MLQSIHTLVTAAQKEIQQGTQQGGSFGFIILLLLVVMLVAAAFLAKKYLIKHDDGIAVFCDNNHRMKVSKQNPYVGQENERVSCDICG